MNDKIHECPICDGTGLINGSEKCVTCNGAGLLIRVEYNECLTT